MKQLQDALTNIDLKLADRKPFRELKRSMDEYAKAQETVQKAQEDLNTVMAGGKVITGLYRDETGKLVTGLLTQEQAEKKLTEAQENRRRKRTAMAQSLQGLRAKCHPTHRRPMMSSVCWKGSECRWTRMPSG